MYFVINSFIVLICIISLVLFTEVFPKMVKAVISIIASVCFSYAAILLIREIAKLTKWYKVPNRFPGAYYILAVTLVLVAVIAFILSKKKTNKIT